MRWLKGLFLLLLLVVLIVAGLAFNTHNQNEVPLDLLFLQLPDMPVSVWVTSSFILGGLFGMLFSSFAIWREKSARRHVEKRLQTTSKVITG